MVLPFHFRERQKVFGSTDPDLTRPNRRPYWGLEVCVTVFDFSLFLILISHRFSHHFLQTAFFCSICFTLFFFCTNFFTLQILNFLFNFCSFNLLILIYIDILFFICFFHALPWPAIPRNLMADFQPTAMTCHPPLITMEWRHAPCHLSCFQLKPKGHARLI